MLYEVITVLANQNGSAVPGMVRNTVADRMLKTAKTNWAKRFVERRQKAKKDEEEAKVKSASNVVKNTKPSHILQEYTGSYSNPGYGEFNITNTVITSYSIHYTKLYEDRHC